VYNEILNVGERILKYPYLGMLNSQSYQSALVYNEILNVGERILKYPYLGMLNFYITQLQLSSNILID